MSWVSDFFNAVIRHWASISNSSSEYVGFNSSEKPIFIHVPAKNRDKDSQLPKSIIFALIAILVFVLVVNFFWIRHLLHQIEERHRRQRASALRRAAQRGVEVRDTDTEGPNGDDRILGVVLGTSVGTRATPFYDESGRAIPLALNCHRDAGCQRGQLSHFPTAPFGEGSPQPVAGEGDRVSVAIGANESALPSLADVCPCCCEKDGVLYEYGTAEYLSHPPSLERQILR